MMIYKGLQLNWFTIIFFSYFLILTPLFGHGDDKHKNDTIKKETVIEESESLEQKNTHSHDEHNIEKHLADSDEQLTKADFKDFPSLHPLVVHFPIVLIILAAISQLISLIVLKKELSLITMIFIAGGCVGSFVAANLIHPHTHGLSENIQLILNEHEKYAEYTLWISGIALLLKILSHFVFKRKLWLELVITITLLTSAYMIGTTGHYGAQLIHIEGVGAKGKYLDIQQENHQH